MERIVLVGAGRSSREIVARLSGIAPLTVVDTSEAALDGAIAAEPEASDPASTARLYPIERRVADASSRLVLEDLRGEPGAPVALVAATGNDRVAVEVCRLSVELGYKPVVALVNEAAAAQECEKLGASAVLKAQLVAQFVEQAIQHEGVGLGGLGGFSRGEIIEFKVLPSSPAIGVPLTHLHAIGWRVAAIYRGDELVLPTGSTRIAVEDRVLIVGQPRLLPQVAETLRVGVPVFPLLHGPNVVVYLPGGRDPGIEEEAEAVATRTRAARLVRLYPSASGARAMVETPAAGTPIAGGTHPVGGRKPVDDVPLAAGALSEHVQAIRAKRPGVVVARPPRRTLGDVLLGRGGDAAVLCNEVGVPLLFPSGSPRFARVVLGIADAATDLAVADIALDLARMFEVPFCIVRAQLPGYLGSDEPAIDALLETIQRRAQLHSMRIEIARREGNPLREFKRAMRPDDLCVLGRRKRLSDGYASPDVAVRYARAGRCSVLVCTSDPSGRP